MRTDLVMNKQRFVVEFVYPCVDAKVTPEELLEIIEKGIKSADWGILVEEKQV